VIRSLVVVMLASCGSGRQPAPTAPPSSGGALPSIPLACRIEPQAVRCTATNPHDQHAIACGDVFVGVRQTAALHYPISRTCILAVAPGATGSVEVLSELRPGELCGPDLTGCELRVFRDMSGGPGSAVVAFVRELEAAAPELGRDRPTLAECEDLRVQLAARDDMRALAKLLEDRDLSAVFCLRLSRRELECARKDPGDDAFEACMAS
jgi:hypothetical protein